jgi:hypothetical protein
MADQSDDTDPDVRRDRLLTQAERGVITKEQAEAAATQGLGPFERRPELPRFDPKLKSHWSIVMAVAWIAWRDFGLVSEQDPQFCSACFHWIYRKWKDPSDKTADAPMANFQKAQFVESGHSPPARFWELTAPAAPWDSSTGYCPMFLRSIMQVGTGAAGLYFSHLCEHALHEGGIAINAARLQ